MTAVCLTAKGSIQTRSWSNIFTRFNTDAKSCLFIKQLTSTCISTILCLRKILSDDCFEEKDFEGLTLKILKRRKGDNYVIKIEEWLEGAFEAIEKKYLKKLILDIQDAESNKTIEVYTITFNYTGEGETVNRPHLSTSNTESGFTPSNTELNTLKLLQVCYAVTQAHSSLPSHVKLSMKLSYYEDTPDDYQPRGYMAWEPVNPEFLGEARCIELGVTATQHHSFKLINKSCLNSKFFKDFDQFKSSNSRSPLEDVSEVVKHKKTGKDLPFDNSIFQKDILKNSSFSPLPALENKEAFVVSGMNSSKSSKKQGEKMTSSSGRKEKTDVENQKVRCACLSSDKSDTMFSCLGCRFLVHAECFGILFFDATRKIRFYCHLCHQKERFKCHDKVLVGLKNSSDQQKLSILRRVLRFCTKTNTITLKRMEKIAGTSCPKNVVIVVLNKMIEIGVAKRLEKRKTYIINNNELNKKLLHYFYKVQGSNHVPYEVTSYSLRSLENLKRE